MSTLTPRPLDSDELDEVRCAARSGIPADLDETLRLLATVDALQTALAGRPFSAEHLDGRHLVLDVEGLVAADELRSAEDALGRAVELNGGVR